jgi:hypothetical protein
LRFYPFSLCFLLFFLELCESVSFPLHHLQYIHTYMCAISITVCIQNYYINHFCNQLSTEFQL